jgi:hypothetical protein
MRRWIPCVAFVLAMGAVLPRARPGAAAEEPKKYHSVQAEVVSADVAAMTITFKADGEQRTLPVSSLAKARLSEVKPGERVELSCKDVAGVHREIVSIRAPR